MTTHSLLGYKTIMERLQKVPAERFKQAFLAYVEANEDDLGWEGFTERDVHGFGAVTQDFLKACEAGAWYQPDSELERFTPWDELTDEERGILEDYFFEVMSPRESVWDLLNMVSLEDLRATIASYRQMAEESGPDVPSDT